jgi:hypothetical protein
MLGVAARCSALVILCLAAGGTLAAQTGEPVDEEAVRILRRLGLDESRVMEHLAWICDVHGPRLTGSPNLRRAQEWAVATLEEWGLENVHLDEWGPFGRGWQLDDFAMRVVGENPWPILALPKAWSPSLEGEVVGEVLNATAMTAEELGSIDLSDKIVLIESPRETAEWFGGTALRFDDAELLALATGMPLPDRSPSGQPPGDWRTGFQKRRAILNVLRTNRPLMIVDRSYKGDYGTLFVTGASVLEEADGRRSRPWETGVDVVPQVTMAVEHFNRICRLLERGVAVRVAVRLRATYFDEDPMEYNVIAELPGGDPELGDQVVMLGAHFDSWHAGTGTTDNGCGSAVMMEAIRLVKELCAETGVRPRRTIRLALWSGEEQGLRGSRAWVEKHLAPRDEDGTVNPMPAHGKVSGYFNLDNGTGRIRGVWLQGNEAVAALFRAWLRPFHDLGAGTLTLRDTGGTDHLAFDAVGIPGFQFIQDPVAYDTRTHHSNMDVRDHAVAEDLRQAATIIACFVWHTAQRNELLPRSGPATAR